MLVSQARPSYEKLQCLAGWLARLVQDVCMYEVEHSSTCGMQRRKAFRERTEEERERERESGGTHIYEAT